MIIIGLQLLTSFMAVNCFTNTLSVKKKKKKIMPVYKNSTCVSKEIIE